VKPDITREEGKITSSLKGEKEAELEKPVIVSICQGKEGERFPTGKEENEGVHCRTVLSTRNIEAHMGMLAKKRA